MMKASTCAVVFTVLVSVVSATDCNLNGEKNTAGVCVCDAGWTGDDCGLLDFLPSDPNHIGYRNGSQASWGGVPIPDPTNPSKIHLFAAQMVNSCPLSSWKNNSKIAHLVADDYLGPYQYVETVHHPFAHNPKILLAPDGTYLLFWIGGWPMAPKQCSSHDAEDDSVFIDFGDDDGPNHDGCGPGLNEGCGIRLAYSKSLAGPWTTKPIVIDGESKLMDCARTNPSAIVYPNGTVLLAFNAGYCHSRTETIGLAVASSWDGQFSLFTPDPILTHSNGQFWSCEDPFLWSDARGLHIIAHSFGPGISLLAFSDDDGHSWTVSDTQPYDASLTFTNGTVVQWHTERPHIVFVDGKPAYFTNGAEPPQQQTMTLVRALNTTR